MAIAVFIRGFGIHDITAGLRFLAIGWRRLAFAGRAPCVFPQRKPACVRRKSPPNALNGSDTETLDRLAGRGHERFTQARLDLHNQEGIAAEGRKNCPLKPDLLDASSSLQIFAIVFSCRVPGGEVKLSTNSGRWPSDDGQGFCDSPCRGLGC